MLIDEDLAQHIKQDVGSGNFFMNVLRGKTYGLGLHYWLFLAAPSFVLGVIYIVVDWHSLSLDDWEWAVGLFALFAIVVYLWGYVGLINCARHRRFRGWAAVAVIVATIGLGRTIYGTAHELVGSYTPREISEEIMKLNSQLPKIYDDGSAWVRLTLDRDVLTYVLEQDQAVGEIDKPSLRDMVCKDGHYFHKYPSVHIFRFIYRQRDGSSESSADIVAADCAPSWYAPGQQITPDGQILK